MPPRKPLKQGVRAAAIEKRDGTKVVVYDTFRPRPKQHEFFVACDTPGIEEVLFHGSIRAGKSQAAGKKLLAWAMKYPGDYGVFRSTKLELEESTKKLMLLGDSDMPPVIPPRLIAYSNETYNYIILVNGARIMWKNMEPDERGKIRNITFAGILIDQAEELDNDDDEDFYVELLGRLSDPNGPRKAILVANPGPETHWLVMRFGLTDETEHLRPPERAAIHVDIMDNAGVLPPSYVQTLLRTEETNPDYYKRMVLGLWGMAEGKRFKCWDPRLHIVERVGDLPFDVLPDAWDVYEGGDWGYDNPTCWEWGVVDHMGTVWFLAEHYAREQTVRWHADAIKVIRKNSQREAGFGGELEPSATWLDPSAWNRQRKEISSVAETFREHGIFPARAQNERIGGWIRLEDYLTTIQPDGYGKIRFARWGCPKAILEIPNLRLKPGTEDVEKQHDHSGDAVRYLIMSRPATPTEKYKAGQEMDRASVIKRMVDRKAKALDGSRILIPGG